MKLDFEKDKLLILLIVTDLGLMLFHVLHVSTGFATPLFAIDRDGGYGEMFQYIKETWIAMLFFLLAVRERRVLYLGFSMLFLFLFFDDWLQVHERSVQDSPTSSDLNLLTDSGAWISARFSQRRDSARSS